MAKPHPLALAFRKLVRAGQRASEDRDKDHDLARAAIDYAIVYFKTWGDKRKVNAVLRSLFPEGR